jgi:Ca2+-binding RTX toxin-like protein
MPTTTIFATTDFNPASIRQKAVIFDAGGIINTGGITNPAALGYTAAYMDSFMEEGFWLEGLDWLVSDVSAQFPNATYFHAVNEAVTYTNNQTAYFTDNGFQGTAGSDVIWDWEGRSIANTGGGADLIVLVGEQNAVDAGSGDDVVFTGDGVDVVVGGNGHDHVLTHAGADHVSGGAGNDWIDGGAGADSLWGDNGADTLFGGEGADQLDGGAAQDLLFGGQDNDVLWGMGQNDRLDGGEGDDILNGGFGADTFVFGANAGHDLVADCNRALDRLEFSVAGTGLTNAASVQAAASVVAGDLVITHAGGSVTLDGLTVQSLAGMFMDFV